MATSPSPKRQISVALSERQLAALEAESERLVARVPDVVPGLVDQWIEFGTKAAKP